MFIWENFCSCSNSTDLSVIHLVCTKCNTQTQLILFPLQRYLPTPQDAPVILKAFLVTPATLWVSSEPSENLHPSICLLHVSGYLQARARFSFHPFQHHQSVILVGPTSNALGVATNTSPTKSLGMRPGVTAWRRVLEVTLLRSPT